MLILCDGNTYGACLNAVRVPHIHTHTSQQGKRDRQSTTGRRERCAIDVRQALALRKRHAPAIAKFSFSFICNRTSSRVRVTQQKGIQHARRRKLAPLFSLLFCFPEKENKKIYREGVNKVEVCYKKCCPLPEEARKTPPLSFGLLRRLFLLRLPLK